MRAEKTNFDGPSLVIDLADQPVAVALDIKDSPPVFKDAGFRVTDLYRHRMSPPGCRRDHLPGSILAPGCRHPGIAGMGCEVRIGDVGADHDHGHHPAGVSQKWKADFPIAVNLAGGGALVGPFNGETTRNTEYYALRPLLQPSSKFRGLGAGTATGSGCATTDGQSVGLAMPLGDGSTFVRLAH